MSIPAKKTDYAVTTPSLLITQLRSKETAYLLAEALGAETQEAENALYTLKDYQDIDAAEGVHLDNLGAYYGEVRQGRSDANFRRVIKAKKVAVACKGTVYGVWATATAAISGISGAVAYVSVHDEVSLVSPPSGPTNAFMHVNITGAAFTDLGQINDIVRLLRIAKAAGVRLNLSIQTTATYSDQWIPSANSLDNAPMGGLYQYNII